MCLCVCGGRDAVWVLVGVCVYVLCRDMCMCVCVHVVSDDGCGNRDG